MENIEFDFEKIFKMRMDKMILDIVTKEVGTRFGDQSKVNVAKSIIMVFINHGVDLSVSIDILSDIFEILIKSEDDKDDKK